MLELIDICDAGPAPRMSLELAPRLNLFTGDNGLGKTFVLDIAFWALTGTWSSYSAAPRRGEGASPGIVYRIAGADGGPFTNSATFDFTDQSWSMIHASKAAARKDHLVLYARVDGGFCVFDPLRKSGPHRGPLGTPKWGVSSVFAFTPAQVWDGLAAEDGIVLCNGLVRDWALWQLQSNGVFDVLRRVLARLSPHPDEQIRPGPGTTRVSIEDVRDIPTIELSYGVVPIVYASAGMRRILSLAYMLTWMWKEHLEAARLKNTAPHRGLTLIFDEVESHLHPQWQRLLMPALLTVAEELDPALSVQVLATTHAPLVLASLEPQFDEKRDALFVFDVHEGNVVVERSAWRPRGDASAWLTSDVFDLGQARSVEAEAAIEKAMATMRDPASSLDEIKRIHHALRAVLKDTDPFWARWLVRAAQAGITP